MSRVHLPRTLDEVLGLLDTAPNVAFMAGGTDLLPLRRAGLLTPEAIICLERVGELRGVTVADGCLRIGAAVTFSELLASRLAAERAPLLARAAACMGSPLVRNMGTLGGNVCTASPAGDSLPPLYVLGASVELASARGERVAPIEDFVLGPGRTDLRPGELLTAVRIPDRKYTVQHFEKVGQRQALAISIVSLAATLRIAPDGCVEEARLALGSVGPTVVRCPEAEEALRGGTLRRETIDRAAALVREAVRPIDDLRASAGYRRVVAGNLLHRLMAAAPSAR